MLKLSKTISIILTSGLFLMYGMIFSASPAFAASCYDASETNAGGIITNVSAVVSSNTQATISWTTDQNSDSYVKESSQVLGHTLFLPDPAVTDSTLTMQHKITLNNLTGGTTYYYEVHSTNASGVASISCNGGNYWTFTMPTTNVTLPVYTTTGGGSGVGGAAGGSSGQTGSATTPPPPASSLNITLPAAAGSPIGNTTGSIVLTIFKYAMGFIGIAALGAILYGAILRITSAGNPAKISEGNAYIIGAISGIALLAGSALILNTINPNLTQIGKTEQALNIPIVTSTPFDFGSILSGNLTGATPYSSSTYTFCQYMGTCESLSGLIDLTSATETDARAYLSAHGVGGTDRPVCSGSRTTGCIDFAGMKGVTLTTLAIISDEAGGVYVTGGTEPGHASGEFSHSTGYKFDLRMDAAATNYVNMYLTKMDSVRSDGAVQYQGFVNGVGVIFANEASATGGPHWDVLVSTNTQCVPGAAIPGTNIICN